MDMNVLNRIGIFLAFLAGFLMAPELIGRERLQRAEIRLEAALLRLVSFSFKLGKWLEKALGKLAEFEESVTPKWPRTRRIELATNMDWERDIQEWQDGLARVGYVRVLSIFGANVVVALLGLGLLWLVAEWVDCLPCTVCFYSLLVFEILGVVIGLALLIAVLLLKILRGNERLAAALTACGIIFYVVGNLSQLLATF